MSQGIMRFKMELKNYQKRTLDVLSKFMTESRAIGCAKAFKNQREESNYPSTYRAIENLEDSPYICLRLPTGGGKTLLGTYAIKIAAEKFLECEYPLVLWLVPTDVIRQQTLEILRSPDNFYRQVLNNAFNENVQIYDITEFRQIRTNDLSQKLNIFVATFNSLRREDKKKSGLKVYQSNEDLMPCFLNNDYQNYFGDEGEYSFANLLANVRPLMIVDEAHNNNTNLSFSVMRNFKASAIIELTATPTKKSNVLVKVSAGELKDEDMIKLPIMLSEIKLSPEAAIDSAVQKRNYLEKLAECEANYLRPIVLFQAENKDKEWNVDKLKNYLVNDLKIDEKQIAIATGAQRGLDDVNLFLRDCPIRYIITVQALKEGWDCSFAYVFCSLAKVRSSKDAEQLLGRVLRMPKAERRKNDALNRAYAFLTVKEWWEAAQRIEDSLVAMGFEEQEAKTAIYQPKLIDTKTTIKLNTSEPPQIENLNLVLQSQTKIEKTSEGYRVTFEDASDDDVREIVNNINKVFKDKKDRSSFLKAVYQKNYSKPDAPPTVPKIKFEVPQLCLNLNGFISKATEKDFLLEDFKLTDKYPPILKNFTIDIDEHIYELDVMDHKISNRYLGNDSSNNLFGGETNWSIDDLIGFIGPRVINSDLNYDDVAKFTRRIIENYVDNHNVQLSDLVRVRFAMVKALIEYISECIKDGRKKGMQTLLFDKNDIACITPDVVHVFNQEYYPLRKPYNGKKKFSKHYYELIEDMNKEEIPCAQYIDTNPNVEFWIRNIDSDPKNSFWLPTTTDKFYPDFVVKLKDGIIAVIEYKGEHLISNDDSKEKKRIGSEWAKVSKGHCRFLMASKVNDQGQDLYTQVNNFLL